MEKRGVERFSVFTNVVITDIDLDALSAEECSVLYQEARYCQAMTETDLETMREITSADITFPHMSGRKQTRNEYFSDVEQGKLRYYTIGIENPVIKVEEDIASVTYTSVLNASAYGAAGTYRMYGRHWYRKISESWMMMNEPE